MTLIPDYDVQVAAIDGRDLDPENGVHHASTGITTLTLWGEIAYQIGGIEGYQLLRGSDTSGIMADKGVGLIDQNTKKQFLKEKPGTLLARIERSFPRFDELKQFPQEYTEMALEAYCLGHISLNKLAELLEIPVEEAKAQVEAQNAPLDWGVSSELELLSDIKNA